MIQWAQPKYFLLNTLVVKNFLTNQILYQINDVEPGNQIATVPSVNPDAGTPYFFTVFGRNKYTGEVSGTFTSTPLYTHPVAPTITVSIGSNPSTATISWGVVNVDNIHVIVWSNSLENDERLTFTVDSGATSISVEPEKFTYYNVTVFVSKEGFLSDLSAINYLLHVEIPFLKDCSNIDDCILGIDEKVITYKIGDENAVCFSLYPYSKGK